MVKDEVVEGRCDIVTNLRMDRRRNDQSQRSQQTNHVMLLKDCPTLSLLEEKTKLIEKSPQRPSTSQGFALMDAQEATTTQQTRKSRSTGGKLSSKKYLPKKDKNSDQLMKAMTTSSHSVLKESSFEEWEHKGMKEQLSNSASDSEQDINIRHSVSLQPKLANSDAATHNPEDAMSELDEIAPDEAECTGINEEDEQHKERKKDPSMPTVRPPEYPRSTFVKIGSLEQGDIFGLTEIPGSTCNLRLSLVSDGAECIFIPKKLFLGEAPAKSRQAALELVNTYPTELIIRQNFARQQEWSLYKARLIRQLLGDRAKRRAVAVKPGKTTF